MEMKLNLKDAKKAWMQSRRPLQMLHDWGVRSDHAYIAGFAATGLALLSHLLSRRSDNARSGSLFGKAAPILFLVGLCLDREE